MNDRGKIIIGYAPTRRSVFNKIHKSAGIGYNSNETSVDALAVSVGTIHGKFHSMPQLDFERIKNLRDAVEAPLVLHGSSGLSDDDFKKAVANGITKINYFTGLVDVATRKTKEIVSEDNFSYLHLNKTVMESVKEEIMRILDVFNSSGKA